MSAVVASPSPTEPTVGVIDIQLSIVGDGNESLPPRNAKWVAWKLYEFIVQLITSTVISAAGGGGGGGTLNQYYSALTIGAKHTLFQASAILVFSIACFLLPQPESLSRSEVMGKVYEASTAVTFGLGMLLFLLGLYVHCADPPPVDWVHSFQNKVKLAGEIGVLVQPLLAGYFHFFVPAEQRTYVN